LAVALAVGYQVVAVVVVVVRLLEAGLAGRPGTVGQTCHWSQLAGKIY
jgi:hypothetical protein